MDETLIEQFKTALVEEQKRLEEELASFAVKDPRMRNDWDTVFPAVSRGASFSHSAQDEQADLREEFETRLAQEHLLESRLREVKHALERIQRGAFGMCKTCGEPIPLERLQANAAAEYDIPHQPKE